MKRLLAIVALALALVVGAFVSPIDGLLIYAAANLAALGWSGRFTACLGAYFDDCLPTIAQTPDSSGTSLTRYLTHALTPAEFVADGLSENLRRVYANRTQVIMRGYQPTTLDMILFGRLKDYGMHLQKMKMGFQSIIQPFVTLPKADVINTGAFVVTAGDATTPQDYQWRIKVQNGPAAFQNSTLPAIDTQFQVGATVLIIFTAGDGSNLVRQMEVISSADSTVGDTPSAEVVVQAPYNQTQWDALTTPEQTTWQPTGGLVMFSGNSTSNYRSRANQKGLYNPASMIQYWFQTMRKMFQYTDAYEVANNAETMTEFEKAFVLLPLAEQIRMLDADYVRGEANNLFWSQPYAGQNVETWQTTGQLPVVYDIDGTTIMDVETRMKGIETQLDECGRVVDLMGGPFDMDVVGPLLYQVARNRLGTGAMRDQVFNVDLLTNRTTAFMLKRMFADRYGNDYNIQYQQQVGKSNQETFSQTSGIWTNSFDLDDYNITLNVMSATWMEDLLSQTPTAHQNAARYAMFLDFSDIDWFVMEQKSRNTEWPPRNVPIEFTRAVIDFNVRTVRLESTTSGIAVKRPSRHLMVKGFGNVCGTMTPSGPCAYEG